MKCIKNCKCTDCEMLMLNEPITFVKGDGFNEKRERLVGVKCMNYAKYAETPEKLKESEIYDDLIYLQ